ncbi:hypothetical protein V1639_08955 [Pseudarthrobacter sp. J75]|uniref:hypothetical protein n=1 Tax=Pseudarthrobacter sp. J75 TaxID=3116486 RepID=UPI002E824777|nr:hypothetical protein [Pseudarthrobacter sp. J75]MEE2529157.1 hypothetical protein [Pseudarthrobacter sp. J75]
MPITDFVRDRSDSLYDPDSGAPSRRIANGMHMQVPGNLTVFRAPEPDMDVVFRVEMLKVGLRPTGVSVLSRVGREVTATHLRAVNVQRLWRAVIIGHIKYVREDHEMSQKDPEGRRFMIESPVRLTDEQLERMRLRGPEYETLEYVSDMYTLASCLGLAPAQFVQDAFAGESLEPLPRTTATKWIKKARDVGLSLGSADHGND